VSRPVETGDPIRLEALLGQLRGLAEVLDHLGANVSCNDAFRRSVITVAWVMGDLADEAVENSISSTS